MTPAKRFTLLIALFFVLTSLFFFRDAVFFGKTFAITDLYRYLPWKHYTHQDEVRLNQHNNAGTDQVFTFYPRRMISHRIAKSARLPLWNPYMLGGMPFLADPHTALFYPLNLFYLIMPPGSAFLLVALIQLFLAGFFGFLFFREIGLHPGAAIFAGLVFMFNPFFITHLINPTNVDSGIWLPLMLFFFERYLKTQRFFYLVGLALAFCMSVLGGFPQIMVFSTYCFLLYAALRMLYAMLLMKHKQLKYPIFKGVAIALILGGLLASLQLLPTLELSQHSARAKLSYEDFEDIFIPPDSLLMYVFPYFFGEPNKNWYGAFVRACKGPARTGSFFRNSFLENNAYLGILPLILVIFALFRYHRNFHFVFFAILVIGGISMTLGMPTFRLAYHFLPGFNFSRICRIVYVYSFGMAGLSGLGLSMLLKSGLVKRNRRLILVSTVILLLFCVMVAFSLRYLQDHHQELRTSLEAKSAMQAGDGSFLEARKTAYSLVLQRVSKNISGWNRGILFGIACILGSLLLINCYHFRLIGKKIFIIALLFLFLIDIFSFGAHYLLFQQEFYPKFEPRAISFLKAQSGPFRIARFGGFRKIFPPNSPTVFNIQDFQGYNALLLNEYGKLAALVEPEVYIGHKKIISMSRFYSMRSPILDLLNVKYILTSRYIPLTLAIGPAYSYKRTGDLKLVFDSDVKIYENRNVLPRAFFVSKFEIIPNEEEILKALVAPDYDPRKQVFLQEAEPALRKISAGESSFIEFDETSPGSSEKNRVRIVNYGSESVELDVENSSAGFLILSDTFHPDWQLFVDGSPQKIYRVNLALRGVFLEPGRHKVAFLFDPCSFKLGLFISLFVFFLLVSWGIYFLGGFRACYKIKSAARKWGFKERPRSSG